MAKCCSDFKSGRVGRKDDERSGLAIRASSQENKTPVEVAILDNKRVAVRDLDHDLGSSHHS